MKKYLLILALSLTMPAWSLCTITNGESVCSISGSSSSNMPLFQNNNNTNINPNGNNINNLSSPNNITPSSGLNSSFSRTQNQNGIQIQGSLGCQFGNCNKGGTTDFLKNQ